VTLWKTPLASGADQVLESSGAKVSKSDEPEAVERYEQIGRLKVEWEWLKKSCGMRHAVTKLPRTREESLKGIERGHESLSVRRQCDLLGIHRSQFDDEPVPETEENLELMRRLDEQYLKTPFWGSRNMTVFLQKKGHPVNRKRTQRLMRNMGLEGLSLPTFIVLRVAGRGGWRGVFGSRARWFASPVRRRVCGQGNRPVWRVLERIRTPSTWSF